MRIPDPTEPIIELTIDSLSYNGGRGVGRYEGLVVFVTDAAPNERVRARVVNKKPRFWEAELSEVLEPSPSRRRAPCPVFGRCGGCTWQHIEYATQLEQKAQILQQSLRSLGAFEMRPIVGAAAEFHYRSRIQLQIQGSQRGFFARRSHALVPIEECWIADPSLNSRLKTLQPKELGHAQKVELALAGEEVVVRDVSREPAELLFSQIHRAQNEVLKTRLLEWVDPRARWIFDLYAGAGNLTVPLAQKFSKVEAIEYSRASVQLAQRSYPQVTNIRWQTGDVGAVLAKFTPQGPGGLVVLDPPRLGCSREVVTQILRHRPSQIVYVSCNPMTFARDARLLLDGGYELKQVQGLDMFPQTEHIELISSFVLRAVP